MNMKTRILTHLALLIIAGFLATGCSATLQHGPLVTTPGTDKGSLAVTGRAQNMNNRIGWGTFTVFAIPVAPVTLNGEGDVELMNQIKDAVVQAGYQVQTVDIGGAAANMPLLSCNVQKFGFRNYTYFFPLVFNWGTIQLQVSVTSPEGKVLWSKTYTGKGNGMYDFNTPVSNALTSILNELSRDLLKADFKSSANG